MLGGQAVRDRERLGEVPRHHHGAVVPDRGVGDRGARQRRALARDRRHDASGRAGVVRQAHGPRQRVVLGLCQEVRRHVRRDRRAVRDDDDLARAGDQVDAHVAEHEALGEGDVEVARPDDLVDRGKRRRPVGQRRHRLGAADPVGLGGASEARAPPGRRGEAGRPGPAARPRRGPGRPRRAPGSGSSAPWTGRRPSRRARSSPPDRAASPADRAASRARPGPTRSAGAGGGGTPRSGGPPRRAPPGAVGHRRRRPLGLRRPGAPRAGARPRRSAW